METEKLIEITNKANDAVKGLDPDLKKSAFETILKKLLDSETFASKPKKQVSKKPKKSKQTSKPSKTKIKEVDETVKKLISDINRTEHQEYFSKMTKMLDKALYILKIALDNGVDGLVPSQIE